ncbi:MAG TPA: hypothetical protein VFZ98_13270 [Vicinamibacterales bacterium]
MRSKKTRAKTAKSPVRGKRRIGLTSAIGPKATTAVVVVVLAGGLWFGAHQRLAAKAKTPALDVETAEMTSAPPSLSSSLSRNKPSTGRANDASASQPVTGASASDSPKSGKGPVTTIEGCLVQSGDAYRLKATSGADAPKARSWKSGFLKKGSASVDVIDASESLGLPNRVGTRVSVTGTLVDREMQARSVHRVSSSCD